ncbi:unnamed protein product [Zymoseptoria tritici ST99CH_1A5]|uniref:Fe2OG dioxygenase domain-containing protein n=2 Tax=Zymoseptoria tritici TaxID=1047171 RepID=A0A1X7RR34_ZYMT9|nr:unnamed protein product [Zymoseptoria tritici ST99CH_3D7]SMR51781.1 unnamed protein product [Zymoseptoria tritici ST99CH_3D1]SMY23542.1 unnamed protein product [Zymoseptoria tritici ST99CH_1A5]
MPHKESSPSEFDPSSYPPFPSSPDFPTLDLQTISLRALLANDPSAQEATFAACKDWGFFYLDLSDSGPLGSTLTQDSLSIARIASQIFQLPIEEKSKYAITGKDLFGYKKVGQTQVDKNHTPDTAEFFNVAKNEMIVPEGEMTRSWPKPVLENRDVFKRYSTAAHEVGLKIVDVLANKLGIDLEEIRSRHRLEEWAGDHVRMTRGPPRKEAEMPEIQTPSHTDFGTITILMNWLGGLQLYSAPNRTVGNLQFDDNTADGTWLWVKPRPNCAIINLGDAAVKFTNGVLCSGRHRVIPAPGEQGKFPRYSIVYFVRPVDECRLKTLRGEGVPVAGDEEEEGTRAKDWIAAQAGRLNVQKA